MSEIEQISTSEIPTLDILKVFFDSVPADEKSVINLGSDLGNVEKLLNFTKALVTVKITNTSKQDIYADSTVNKYLRFKVIFYATLQQKEYYEKNIVNLDKLNDKNIKTFSFADLKLLNDSYTFSTEYILKTDSSTKVIKNSGVGFLIYSHYDIQSLEKDFNFSIGDTLGLEKIFYSDSKSNNIVTLYNDKKVILRDLFQSGLNSLNADALFSRSKSKIKPVKKFENFISPLISTKDNKQGKDVLRYGFFFDKDRFVLENTIFPELYGTTLWNKVLTNSKDISIEITRYKVSDIEKTGNHFNEILSRPQIDNRAAEIFPNLVFYTGIDGDVYTRRSGMYGYKVKLGFVDGAFSVILDQINKIKTNIKNLKEYKTIVSQPEISTGYIKDLNPYIDEKKGSDEADIAKFKKGKYSYEEDRVLESAQEDYNRLLTSFSDTFVEAYSCLYNPFQYTSYIITAATSPGIANLDSINTVIEFHIRLLNEFKNILHRKLNLINESVLLNEQIPGFEQVPVALQLMTAFRNFDTQIDSDEYPSFGLRYHIATGINDNGIVSVSDVNELKANNVYGNKRYIGPKFIYLSYGYALPLALTGIVPSYFDTIQSILQTYKTKTFEILLKRYGYFKFPSEAIAIGAAQTPLLSRTLLNKNKISFDGIINLESTTQSINNSLLDIGLQGISNLIEEWSNTIKVNEVLSTEISREYVDFNKRNIGPLKNIFQDPSAFSCFKVIYDGVKQVYELQFPSIQTTPKDREEYIVSSQVSLLNDFKLVPYDERFSGQSSLFTGNNSIKYIKEYNTTYTHKYTKLCYLYEYANSNASLTHTRYDKVPVFNRWFFLNDNQYIVGPTESITPPITEFVTPVTPISPTIPVTPTSPTIPIPTLPTAPVITVGPIIPTAPQIQINVNPQNPITPVAPVGPTIPAIPQLTLNTQPTTPTILNQITPTSNTQQFLTNLTTQQTITQQVLPTPILNTTNLNSNIISQGLTLTPITLKIN